MNTTRRRIGNPAWLGLALVMGLPALAEAQLFPNRTVTRQREACAAEPPFYSQVRRNYFGYYPTCWSKFPDGWGCPCPNPELPNRVAAFQIQKRDPLPPASDVQNDGVGNEGMDDDTRPLPDPRPADDTGLPAVPNPGRSPFDTDTTPSENIPRRNLPTPNITNPPQTSPTPAPIDRTNANPSTSAVAQPNPVVGLLEMPRIAPPVASASATAANLNAGALALTPEATLASTETVTRPNLGPLPAATPTVASTPIASELIADPALLAQSQPGDATAPAQAPQRKGILSGLFNGSKRRR